MKQNRNRRATLTKIFRSDHLNSQTWIKKIKRLLLFQNTIPITGIGRFIQDLICRACAEIKSAVSLKEWSGFLGIMGSSILGQKSMNLHAPFASSKFLQKQSKIWDIQGPPYQQKVRRQAQMLRWCGKINKQKESQSNLKDMMATHACGSIQKSQRRRFDYHIFQHLYSLIIEPLKDKRDQQYSVFVINQYLPFEETISRFIWTNIINVNKSMSLTRKCLDRKHLMCKLEQVKLDISGQLMKSSLGQTVKKDGTISRKSKSRQKTVKLGERTGSLRQPGAKSKSGYRLDRSKESRESRESLLKSTQSYYIANQKSKKEPNSKLLKSYKSKDNTNQSNIINSTFQMQTFATSHKKKASNFSSIVAPKRNQYQSKLNKSALNHSASKDPEAYHQLLLRSQTVLDQYKTRYQALEKQNKRYKKRYQQALKKIKHLQYKY